MGKGCGLENWWADSWFLFSADVLTVPKAGSSCIHHCDPCREVTLSSALAATALAGDTEKAP